MSSLQYKFIDKLRGKRILIFGSTSGIGFAIAEGCIEHGASVILSGSNAERLAKTVQRLQDSYGDDVRARISTHVCDLADEENLETNVVALFEAATQHGKEKIDHIAVTAGDRLSMLKIEDATVPELRKAQSPVRYLAPIIIAKHVKTYMHASTKSSFTLTSAVTSLRPPAGWSIPAAGSATREGLVRGLAVDLAPIRVNLVSPGAVDTEFWGGRPDQMKKFSAEKTLVKKMGAPEDVAEAYLYGMKDGFITGQVLVSDGGYLLA